jgi:hypothetical protein
MLGKLLCKLNFHDMPTNKLLFDGKVCLRCGDRIEGAKVPLKIEKSCLVSVDEFTDVQLDKLQSLLIMNPLIISEAEEVSWFYPEELGDQKAGTLNTLDDYINAYPPPMVAAYIFKQMTQPSKLD